MTRIPPVIITITRMARDAATITEKMETAAIIMEKAETADAIRDVKNSSCIQDILYAGRVFSQGAKVCGGTFYACGPEGAPQDLIRKIIFGALSLCSLLYKAYQSWG